MSSRGQKRTETVDGLPADKRACNLLERPSTSNSSPQTPITSAQEGRDVDMETSSSTSGSTRSEGDGEKDSMNGSCDSDNNYRDYYRHRPWSDQSKFKKVLASLSEEVDDSGQLALLTELCELLSFCSDSSLSSLMADSFSPILVKLARHEGNPEIMLLSVRAITYLCDVNPRSSGFLVRHDAVPALCQRLLAIEYLDVAEQCLLALEKISREQPLACLHSGAIMAVLSYIDFFSTSVQRLALSTVVNICKKLSSESPSLFMDAVPILCNLLQFEDRQIVESVTTSLIRIVEKVCHSSDMLDEVCKHGLIQHALHLIGLNSRTTLCQPTYIGLIGLLVKLASGSTVATKTLFELDLSVTVKEMLSTYDLSHGTQSTPMVEGYHGQMNEVSKLLNELLPTITDDQDDQLKTDKKTFLLNHPDILQKFGVDLLPVLIQVVNSGVNLFICYGCLSVVNKLVHFSTCDALSNLLRTANFSSFLAGVFTRKDHHLIILALQIVETIMLKLPHVFLHSFIKEGVLFAICALHSPDTELSPDFDGMQLGCDGTQNSIVPDVRKCPCFSFDACQSSSNPEKGTCKLQKDAVENLAKHIWTTYFATEATNPERGVTDALQKLRTLSDVLTNLVNESRTDISSSQKEEDIYDLLSQIMSKLNEKDSISTFEFVESGITKALVNYLLNGRHLFVDEKNIEADQLYIMEKRFEVFGQLLLPSSDTSREEFPLLTLTQRLQSALSSLENLPVVSSHISKSRNSYATVPFGHCTSYPCLKVHFVRENGDSLVRDYAEDLATVDPFLPLDAIEEYLWPRVSYGETKNLTLCSKDSKENYSLRSHSPSDSSTSKGKRADLVPTEILDIHKLEDKMPESFEQKNMGSADVTDLHTKDLTEQEEHSPLQDDGGKNTDGETTKPKLLLFLEGQQLNSELSLYQCILGQQTVGGHDSVASVSLWTRTYRITYRCVTNQSSHGKHCHEEAQYSLSARRALFCQPIPFLSRVFVSEIELKRLGPSYDVLFLLKSLEEINRLRFHLKTRERMDLFAEGKTDDLESLNIPINEVCHKEFVNSKLTEKLEQQMRYPTTVSVGSMPAWCTQLMAWCPFLFGFEARYKYFHLAAFGRLPVHTHTSSHSNVGSHSSPGGILRKKFLVHRNEILESAAKMMELHARQKVLLEVEYNEEVGSGLGPTLEFYTLVCHEFQRSGLGMWRDDHVLEVESSGVLVSPFGLFPRPWSPSTTTSSSSAYSEVIKKFGLLGQMVAKALQDGRILDLPFSKTFYKLILGKNLSVFDIQSIDPAFGRTLIEFQTIVERKRYSRSLCEENSDDHDVSFRSTKIEDLCLDFTLPGYPDYVVESASDLKSVNLCNLEEYVKVMVDATVKSGISRQVEAFKSGFNQVFPIRHLKVFTEEELERLLCGEHVLWKSDELTDHIKFDHGYTVSSPPIINLLGIMREFDHEQQRAFLQFVTGAPRLPTGGLASLNPKLTIVRKHCSKGVDEDLPSVMTCANYLKLPPYSSKEVMKEKLLYAITEGQGSFHLS